MSIILDKSKNASETSSNDLESSITIEIPDIPPKESSPLPKAKSYKTSLANILSTVIDNDFLLRSIDNLRYDLKHHPGSIHKNEKREKYTKLCVKATQIIKNTISTYELEFNKWEKNQFQKYLNTPSSQEEILKNKEIKKQYKLLSKSKKVMKMIDEKKLF